MIHRDGTVLKSYRDLMYAMALRAKKLADMPIDELRMNYPEVTETLGELVRLCKNNKLSRGQMIEDILIDNFDIDFDLEFEE